METKKIEIVRCFDWSYYYNYNWDSSDYFSWNELKKEIKEIFNIDFNLKDIKFSKILSRKRYWYLTIL